MLNFLIQGIGGLVVLFLLGSGVYHWFMYFSQARKEIKQNKDQ